MGLHRVWPEAEIVGIDIVPQPHYPFTFIQADALTYPLEEFDFIWASPPCQAFSKMKYLPNHKAHPDLIPTTRERLVQSGKPYAIENVISAPLLNPVVLCGSMFNLKSSPERYLRRHRLFECPFPIAPRAHNHKGLAVGVYGHGSAGHIGQRMRTANKAEASILMDIDWMTRDGLSQAIPPAYSEYIARQYMLYLAA